MTDCGHGTCTCHPDATHLSYRSGRWVTHRGHKCDMVGVPLATCTHEGCGRTATWGEMVTLRPLHRSNGLGGPTPADQRRYEQANPSSDDLPPIVA